MTHKSLLVAALIAIPFAAAAAQNRAPAGPSPDEIVQARHAAFMMSAGTLGALKGVLDSGGDVRPMAFGARALGNWARAIPSMFPAGTALPSSHARPEVWSDRAGFEARAAAYAAAADALAQAAQAGDREAATAAFASVRGSCGACHTAYRVEAAH
jgi:cytochrome c556